MISLIKNELKRFKTLLSSGYSECSKREEEDEGQSKVKKGVLKITLDILRMMNQKDLANTLLTSKRSELCDKYFSMTPVL